MKKINKKDVNNIVSNVEKAIEEKEDLVVLTDGITFIQGNPIGVMALICKGFKAIEEEDMFGKIVASAALKALNEEANHKSDDDKMEELLEGLNDLLEKVTKNEE